ncbi:hypothetical protein XIS1_1420007 [Xenorhabdus innexi]|uniref:Uncharacterized protein n=1 Tax=Xenorhabdus innexi TaxID=290109 RepID=A0A1N6MU45_9GAMM|nr:hypothetical protein XIS1_1420007 [Xenorhabdus innexi]
MDFKLRRGGKGASPGSIDNYVTGVTGMSEHSQQRGSLKDEVYTDKKYPPNVLIVAKLEQSRKNLA